MEDFAVNNPNWSFGSRLNAEDDAFAYYSKRYVCKYVYGDRVFCDAFSNDGYYVDSPFINFWQALERGDCADVREWIKKRRKPK